MSTSTLTEPFTPRGVAAFARAKISRLVLAQLLVALLAAISLTWFLNENCFSVVQQAIQNLPDKGKIYSGKLNWRGDSPKTLAEGRLLAMDVDLNHSGAIHSTTDVQIEFGNDSIRAYSFLGYSDFYYPPWPAPFNRTDLQPLWGAWSAEIIFVSAATFFIGLLLSWTILATIYFPPIWLAGFFTNRNLSPGASWKLSSAALLPGALLLIAAILFYNFGFLNLVSLSSVFVAHFVIAWIYLIASFFFLPRVSSAVPKENPFQSPK